MSKNTERKKLTLKDLAPKPFRIDLVHPEMGETGAWIEINSPQSQSYFFKLVELSKTDASELTPAEQMKQTAELTATLVVSWDNEFFETECTIDNAVEVLSDVQNFWIRDAINAAIQDNANFFKKP